MNVDILDPGLFSSAGHHLEWDTRLARELAARGHQVRLFAHRQFDDAAAALLRKHAEVHSHFRISPYLVPALFDGLADNGIRVFDPLAGQLAHFLDGARLLAEDLTGIEGSELTIWPSLTANQLYALALASAPTANAACIQVEPSHGAPNGAMFWRYAWLKAREAGAHFRLGVTVAELQRDYASVFPGERIHAWPICVDARPPPVPHQQIARIGFFGQQRGEKGAALLQDIISPLLAQGLEVVVHDSGMLVRGEGSEKLIRLGYVEDIVAEISRCDLIVAPYDPFAYRSKGSSIVWEAIACGVPVVLPSNSAPGRFVATLGAGVGVQPLNVDEIGKGIRTAHAGYKDISRGAFLASHAWMGSHGVGRFANALLSPAS